MKKSLDEETKKLIEEAVKETVKQTLAEQQILKDQVKKKNKKPDSKEPFIIIYSFTSKYLAEKPGITKMDYRVFNYICSVSVFFNEYEEYTGMNYSPTDIAKAIEPGNIENAEKKRSEVSKALKRLAERGLILNIGENKKGKLYLINPEAAYRGSQNIREKLLEYILEKHDKIFFECDFIEEKVKYLKERPGRQSKDKLIKYFDLYKSKNPNITKH